MFFLAEKNPVAKSVVKESKKKFAFANEKKAF
jgi:hypothetical protein